MVKVIRSKERCFRSHLTNLPAIIEVKGHMGQGQTSYGQGQRSTLKVKVKGQKCDFRSHLTVLQLMCKGKGRVLGSKVTWVKGHDIGRWAHINVNLLHLTSWLTLYSLMSLKPLPKFKEPQTSTTNEPPTPVLTGL